MRVLEVRFHPHTKSVATSYVVARVWCGTGAAQIEPIRSAAAEEARLDAEAVLAKLRFLVDVSRPAPFEPLRKLRSDYWSFVEIEG